MLKKITFEFWKFQLQQSSKLSYSS
jgi:hypothetical protein